MSKYGLPLDADQAPRALHETCRFATPFNIESLRVLARRSQTRAAAYNDSLSAVDGKLAEQRWALWAAANNARRRLERALVRAAA